METRDNTHILPTHRHMDLPARRRDFLYIQAPHHNRRTIMEKRRRQHHGDGSVYPDKKNNRWAGSFYTQEGKRRYVYGKTEREAWEKLRAAQYAEKQGTLAKGPKQTVKDYLNYWLEE